jgi:hypothetical protein
MIDLITQFFNSPFFEQSSAPQVSKNSNILPNILIIKTTKYFIGGI